MRRLQIIALCLPVLLPAPSNAAPATDASPPGPQPNIIVILADDLGYADLGCQGSPDVKTPAIDSIAANGVRCTAGYVTTPHLPMEAKPEDRARFPGTTDPLRRTMLAMMACLDDNVGLILAALRDHRIEDNTLIFFLSDNGGYDLNASRNDPFRGGKSQVLEGGIRVPYLVQWKGRLPPGRICDKPVSSIDIVPTALAAAGATAPEDPATALDGTNLLPFLAGEHPGLPHECLFWYFPFPGNQPDRHRWAIRQGDWKLVKNDRDGMPLGLYNLASDPGETKNLSHDQPERASQMRSAFETWRPNLPPLPEHPLPGRNPTP